MSMNAASPVVIRSSLTFQAQSKAFFFCNCSTDLKEIYEKKGLITLV